MSPNFREKELIHWEIGISEVELNLGDTNQHCKVTFSVSNTHLFAYSNRITAYWLRDQV